MTNKINLGLGEEVRKKISTDLAALLADEYFLYLKTLNYHWNITGETFISLHELLEEQYEWLKDVVDSLAERIRSLGHIAPGTYKQFCETSHSTDGSGNLTAHTMMEDLVTSHEKVIHKLRDTLESMQGKRDFASEDLLTGILGEHEKKCWMLRSHLQKKPE